MSEIVPDFQTMLEWLVTMRTFEVGLNLFDHCEIAMSLEDSMESYDLKVKKCRAH